MTGLHAGAEERVANYAFVMIMAEVELVSQPVVYDVEPVLERPELALTSSAELFARAKS